jgi:fructokinase
LDDRGKELLEIFRSHGVCTDFFQIDTEHETGKVFAEPNEFNEVVYDIVMPVAWDFISCDQDCLDLASQADYFVFGSLAARNAVSKNSLLQLLEVAKTKVLDINLRAPHYNRHIVEELLQHADFLKLNLAEIELITGWFSHFTDIEDRIKSVADQFEIHDIVVTLGGDGAIFYTGEKIFKHPGFAVKVVDTVGSGDAFLAGLLSKLMQKTPPAEALDFANRLGAFIATRMGACPAYTLQEVDKLTSINQTTPGV